MDIVILLQLNSNGCSASNEDQEITRRLEKETETCQLIDQQYHTHLPEYDINAPTKCTRFEKLTYEGVSQKGQCESVEMNAYCQPGCKPFMMISKPFTFKCQGNHRAQLLYHCLSGGVTRVSRDT